MTVQLPPKLLQAVTTPFDLATAQEGLKLYTQWLDQQFSNLPIRQLVQSRVVLIDQLLLTLWEEVGLAKSALALVAVGGYGRNELHLFSDIDILILVPDQLSTLQEQQIQQFIQTSWDLKLEIGHSVRTIQHCLEMAAQDIKIATNFLEKRLLTGDQKTFDLLEKQLDLHALWSPTRFFKGKLKEQEERHQRYQQTAYHLEPNIKANPGGLRDIQTIFWVAKHYYQITSLHQLIQTGYLTEEEANELLECRDLLWLVRMALHLESGRNQNNALFDFQATIAKRLGFGDVPNRSIVQMMKRVFRVFRRVIELNQMLLQSFDQQLNQKYSPLTFQQTEESIILDENFVISGQLIRVTHPDAFFQRSNVLQLFLHIADHEQITGIHLDTIRLIRRVRRRLMGDLQDFERCQKLFVRLFSHPKGMGKAFDLIYQQDILSAYLPQWRQIVGQMQFDLFHAYTVDLHTYRLIKNLYRFLSNPLQNHFPESSIVLQGIVQPELLYFAGLFHDIAKGRGGDHSELGAVDVLDFSKRHYLPEEDGALISWLVAHHLLMSVTAQRKDIHDPDIIKQFAKQVSNLRQLDYLYTLTVADIRATNDNLWNSWRSSLLNQLYSATRVYLLGHAPISSIRDRTRRAKSIALQELHEQGFSKSDVDQLWKQFYVDYFYQYQPQHIVWHCRHILQSPPNKPLVLVSEQPLDGASHIFIYFKESKHVFAAIANAIDNKRLNIQEARIISGRAGNIINSFLVLEKNGTPIQEAQRIQDLKASIIQALLSSEPVKFSRKRLARRLRSFDIKPQVQFKPTLNQRRTIMEIRALDLPGLLAVLAQELQRHRCYIHNARITTVGEKVEDTFILTNTDDLPLSQDQQQQLKTSLIKRLNRQKAAMVK